MERTCHDCGRRTPDHYKVSRYTVAEIRSVSLCEECARDAVNRIEKTPQPKVKR